jgi:ABC-type iron transport system FetAB permease component
MEEEQLRLLEEARKSEEIRLQQAILVYLLNILFRVKSKACQFLLVLIFITFNCRILKKGKKKIGRGVRKN